MINGKILETSIEKLKYLYGLKSSNFEYISIEIEPHISQRSGKIYEYYVEFMIKAPIESNIDSVTYKLRQLDKYFFDLLHEYTLSQDGKLIYGHLDDFSVSEGHLLETKTNGWEEMNFKINYSVLLDN